MKIMVGIDLHSNNALCGLMEESGQRLVHKKLPRLLTCLRQSRPPRQEAPRRGRLRAASLECRLAQRLGTRARGPRALAETR